MLTIETVATIEEPGTLTARVPPSVVQGEHRVVIVIEEAVQRRERSPAFPDLASFRDGLGAPFHEGNTIVEMREQERD